MGLWDATSGKIEYASLLAQALSNSNRFQNSWWDVSFNNAAKSTTTWMMALKVLVFLFCPKGCVLGRRHQAWHHWQSPYFWKLHCGQHHRTESKHSVLPICGCFQYSWPWATVGAHQLHHKGTTWVHSNRALKSFLNGSYSWATSVSRATLCQPLHESRSFLFQLCCLFSPNLIWQESFTITSNNSTDKCESRG